ncbi:MAG TPA: restriction endonuclease subunit S, partial [Desulfosporosinus sp.]
YYLLYILKDTKIKGQLTGINRGIRQANISNTDILALNIPLPTVKLQTQFASIVTKIEEQKALVQKAIDETQYLFDSLMCEYFE